MRSLSMPFSSETHENGFFGVLEIIDSSGTRHRASDTKIDGTFDELHSQLTFFELRIIRACRVV